ncbi:ATP-binding protein [Pelagicoccus sp. SDUM812005]|uniref:ATP-binding protein n=1 Tax=Pelagicoccus sp. SDUM812005 TaxID=3041257 RepID=UPI00280EFDA2|nr:ATP-binding protein [Pelagicoccus sp. SDUM812005]MDQ8182503.1 ATP-binding protein [Pelagicoccus sp. SDUM812005]
MTLLVRDRFRILASAVSGIAAAGLVRVVWPDAIWLMALLPMSVALGVSYSLKGRENGRGSRKEPREGACVTPNECHSALSAAGVGALLWDLETDELLCTEDVFEILGRKKPYGKLSSEAFREAVHPDDRSAFDLAVEWVKGGKRRSPIDCRFVKAEGGVVWVELTLCLVNGEQGARIAGAMTDVTERKHVEAELDRGVAYLEAILENTKNMVFSMDTDYRLTVFNSRFLANVRAIYGNRLHVGDSILEEAPAAIAKIWKPRFARALAGESFHLEEVFKVKGKRFYFDVSLKPIRENGIITGATVYSRNITDQKIREREWIEAKERAEESDRLKSAFLANMSHEIRTPLNAVMGFAQLLKAGGGTREEREKFVDIILSNGNHLLRILGDIIELAQIESNQLRVEPVTFDLRLMLTEIYSAFNERLRAEKESPIEIVVDNQIRDPDRVTCDETRLKQIIYNLVSNSIKFTMQGSIHVGYERRPDGMIEFYVADTGMGVPEELKERIFHRFRQGEGQTGRRNDGVGLGLSICQGLVGLLGGRIWFEDNLPNGTVFRFTVRDQAEERCEDRKVVERQPEGESKPPKGGIREGSKVLVAEDDDMNFQVVDEFLRNQKLVSVRAENGEEAVLAVENDREIKLVVMDISMPVLNGLEATKRIKEIRPDLPVIAHTAHAMRRDLEEARNAGCSDCLVKPISIDRFKLLLARYV